ncbi:hypothetical protein EYF80_031445 [Liparis tanakae]|uniref:Uncharacterized protein n=1 Tax=Liparis tanakae TaxID=230148 RepID=A0A4Z2GZY0_9TELE|nr:hypothetical protein EYF80_031445 [Liparis tanakae]
MTTARSDGDYRILRKHFVSSGFEDTAITSEMREDRNSPLCSGGEQRRTENHAFDDFTGGTHPLRSSLVTSPRHGYKRH